MRAAHIHAVQPAHHSGGPGAQRQWHLGPDGTTSRGRKGLRACYTRRGFGGLMQRLSGLRICTHLRTTKWEGGARDLSGCCMRNRPSLN